MKKLLSIIIPVYNVESSLEKCLNSIIQQMDFDCQLILINDGSTDNSAIICKKYICNNVMYIEQENRGLSAARNKGLEIANSTYVMFMDSDDYVEQNIIKDFKNNIMQGTDLYIYGFVRDIYIDNQFNKRSFCIPPKATVYNSTDDIYSSLFALKKNALADASWNKVYRLSLLKEKNIEFPKNELYEDIEFIFQLLPHLKQVQTIDKWYYHYIYKDNVKTITSSFNLHKMDYLTKRCYTMLESLENKGLSKILANELKQEVSYWYARYLRSSLMDLNVSSMRENFDNYLKKILEEDAFELFVEKNETRDLSIKKKISISVFRTKSSHLIKGYINMSSFFKFKIRKG